MNITNATRERRLKLLFSSLAVRLQRLGWQSARRAGQMRRSRSGTSAIEFALILPAFTTIALGIGQISDMAVGATHMQTAVRTTVQYALAGGTDMTEGANLGLSAWPNRPGNATLAASEYCTCDGVTTVCTQTCNDGSVPNEFVTVTAAGRLGGTVYYADKTLTETARIR